MPRHSAWIAALALLPATFSIKVWADDAKAALPPPMQQESPAAGNSSVIGTKVLDSSGDSVGTIQGMIPEQTSGKTYAIVRFERIQDQTPPHNRDYAVPWRLFTSTSNGQLILDVDSSLLSQAPALDKSNWQFAEDQIWLIEVDRYWASTAPAGESAGSSSGTGAGASGSDR